MMTAVVTVRAAACEPHAVGRAGGGKMVAFASHSVADGRRLARTTRWDDVRWPAVAATLRGRGRVCAAQVGRTDCIGWPRRGVQLSTFVYHLPFKRVGRVSVPRILVYGGSAHVRLAHGTGTCFLSRVFIGGGFFFTKNARLRLAPRSVVYSSVYYLL